MTLKEFIQGMPKAENHVHLDGATSAQSALVLSEKNGVPLPFQTLEEADALYRFDNLDGFLRIINAVCQVIRTADDFRYLTVELARDAARQNIRYREVMFSCAYHEARGIPFSAMMEGFIAGRREARERYGVLLVGIPELDRTIPPEENLAFIERMLPFRKEAALVAVGLDNAEAGYPAHRHAAAFARAGELGFGRTAHAGEAYGPVSVTDTLDSLHTTRIDHGVRSLEDPALVERLAREKILLTICPLSNVGLKVYPDMKSHSFKKLFDAGVPVSINSDDPPFFLSDLNDNYLAVMEAFSLGLEQLHEIAQNAFAYSYAPQEFKERSLRELDDYFRLNAGLVKTGD